MKLHQQINIIP